MKLDRRYVVGKIDGGNLPYKHQFKKCKKNLSRSCFFAIVCALISFHNILNVETSYILEILFYVNIIVTILFYLKGIYYSKCCRCNRKVPVRRQNIGRIMSGQMPLCQTCKLIYGFDFVVETEGNFGATPQKL